MSQQTVSGPQIAPNLFATADTTTSSVYNQVTIGTNADGSLITSPTVTFAVGTDVGRVSVQNQSRLYVVGGVVNGSISTGKDTLVNISGGTVGDVFQSSTGTGKITISGGSTRYVAPRNELLMTGGSLITLDTFGGARVRVEGGSVTQMWLFGGPPISPTSVVIAGGTIGTIDYRSSGNIVTILGGSVGQIWGAGGSANIYGGAFGPDALINFRSNATRFDIFGENLSFSGGSLGTFTDQFGRSYNGVWWNVAGTLNSGDLLNTRYFERAGSLDGPASLVFNVIPAPGTLLVMGLVPVLGLRRRRAAAAAPR